MEPALQDIPASLPTMASGRGILQPTNFKGIKLALVPERLLPAGVKHVAGIDRSGFALFVLALYLETGLCKDDLYYVLSYIVGDLSTRSSCKPKMNSM